MAVYVFATTPEPAGGALLGPGPILALGFVVPAGILLLLWRAKTRPRPAADVEGPPHPRPAPGSLRKLWIRDGALASWGLLVLLLFLWAGGTRADFLPYLFMFLLPTLTALWIWPAKRLVAPARAPGGRAEPPERGGAAGAIVLGLGVGIAMVVAVLLGLYGITHLYGSCGGPTYIDAYTWTDPGLHAFLERQGNATPLGDAYTLPLPDGSISVTPADQVFVFQRTPKGLDDAMAQAAHELDTMGWASAPANATTYQTQSGHTDC